jgi:hypothetical protein
MAFLSDQDFYRVGINFGKSSHSSSFLELLTHEILMSTTASPEGKLLIHELDRGLSLIVDFDIVDRYIEVSMSLPGTAKAQGFWPAAWTMGEYGPPQFKLSLISSYHNSGNLARAGYGSTAEGTWPYR